MRNIRINKIISYLRKYGILGFLGKTFCSICSPFFSYHPLNFYGIRKLPQSQVEVGCSLEIRQIFAVDIDLVCDLLSYSNEPNIFEWLRFRFDNKSELFLAFNKNQVVHSAWAHYFDGINEVFPLVKIKRDEAFIGRCETHPEFRGKNIYPVVLQHIVRHVFARNKKKCFISTDPKNIASIKGIEKAGFSFVWKKRKIRLFGKVFNNEWDSSKMINNI